MTTVLLGIFVFLLASIGAAVGSFLNVVIWRVPEKKSLLSPPSHCPKCNSSVRWFDNIPIASWFFLGGKCRDCKEPISFRYPLVEALSCFVSLIISWALFLGNWTGWSSQAFYWEDYAVWKSAYSDSIVDHDTFDGKEDSGNSKAKTVALSFSLSEEGFLSLLRSTSFIAIIWFIVIDVALMLGFVEWDYGYSPGSLLFAAYVILIMGAIFVCLINDSDCCLIRSEVYIGSAFLGALGVYVCFPLLARHNRKEYTVLGAICGVCLGFALALPGSLILSLVSVFLKRKLHREVFGLVVFGGITLLLLFECFIMTCFG